MATGWCVSSPLSAAKDAAKVIIDSVFTKEESEDCEFVYIPHPYKGHNSKQDYIEVWYRKEKK